MQFFSSQGKYEVDSLKKKNKRGEYFFTDIYILTGSMASYSMLLPMLLLSKSTMERFC